MWIKRRPIVTIISRGGREESRQLEVYDDSTIIINRLKQKRDCCVRKYKHLEIRRTNILFVSVTLINLTSA